MLYEVKFHGSVRNSEKKEIKNKHGQVVHKKVGSRLRFNTGDIVDAPEGTFTEDQARKLSDAEVKEYLKSQKEEAEVAAEEKVETATAKPKSEKRTGKKK